MIEQLRFTNYIEQIKKAIIKKRKWREGRGYPLFEIDGETIVMELDYFIAAGSGGSVDGYKCRRCGHFQTSNNKPCEKCGR